MRLLAPALLALAALALGACSRTGAAVESKPKPAPAERKYYDMERDSYTSWRIYSADGPTGARVVFTDPRPDAPGTIALHALSGAAMGLNLRVPALQGRVTFEYSARIDTVQAPELQFFVLPMQSAMDLAAPPIEVGSKIPGDPRNATSPFRRKFVVPAAKANGEWHAAAVEFNFTGMPGAGYAIVAPRINEGASTAVPGSILLRKVTVFISE